MNREIKFRAWDTSDKDKGPYMLGPYDLTDAIFSHTEIRKMPLMQFTGLKDKNGKEIYEGDIIELFWPFVGSSFTTKVIWVQSLGMWAMEEITKDGGGLYHYFGDQNTKLMDIEVTGNIFQNP